MNRLTKRIGDNIIDVNNKYVHLSHKDLVHELFNRLAEYEDLEENDLLIKLPFKIGESIYKINTISCCNCKYSRYYCQTEMPPCPLEINTVKFDYYMITDINKKIFKTYEEAENKLKELEEN